MWRLGGLAVVVLLTACAPGSEDATHTPAPPATQAGTPTAQQTPTGSAPSPTTSPTPADSPVDTAEEAGEGEVTGTPEVPPPFEEETVEDMDPITAGTGPVATTEPPRPREAPATTAPMATPDNVRAEVARLTLEDRDGITETHYQVAEEDVAGRLVVESQCHSTQPTLLVEVRRAGRTETVEVPCHHQQGLLSSTTVGGPSDPAGRVSLEVVADPTAEMPLAPDTSAWVRVLRG